MKKKQWALGILCILLGVIIIMGDPSRTQAASQSDRNAYWAVFDATYYYNAYPDVAAACGANEEALFNHFVSFGVYEGRSASAAFNPQAYRSHYTDLQEAFGDDMAAYCRHYVTFGRTEGRNACADGQAAVQIKVTVPKKAAPTAKGEKEQAGEEKNKAKQTEQTKETAEEKKETTKETESKTEEKEPEDTETASIQESDAPSVGSGDAAAEDAQADDEEQTQAAQTVIGTYTTYYEANVSRAVNVELAADRINGIVVAPGEKFSFSNTVLDRTTANGYVEGPIFVKGQKSTGIGGGVCQVSSTLYAAMIDAELPATERHPHSRAVDYLPSGLDATIAGNYMDLKFTNTFSQPLLIQASAEGGKLTVTLVLQ